MNSNYSWSKSIKLSLLVTCVVFLSGCDWFKGDKQKQEMTSTSEDTATTAANIPSTDSSAVLVTITNEQKPIITANMLEEKFNDYVEKNQQAKALLQLMPDMEERFLDGLVNLEIVAEYVRQNGLDKSASYKDDIKQVIESGKQMVNAKYFAQAHPVSVTDSEVRAFYDENKKTMPEIIVSRGGVETTGVVFDDESRAKAFFEKAKGKSSDFNKLIKEDNIEGLKREFNLVNEQSVGIDPALRDKIMKFQSFPTVDLIKVDDKSYWVVNATKKEDPKYRSFDEIKVGLKEFMSRDKQAQLLQKVLDDLKKQYAVKVNKEYFEKKKAEKQKTAQNDAPEIVDLQSFLQAQGDGKAQDETVEEPITQAV